MNIAKLETKTLPELRTLARDHNVPRFSRLKKQDLIIGSAASRSGTPWARTSRRCLGGR